MSCPAATVLFEHPLNEKMRIWLRLEFLLQQAEQNHHINTIASALTLFRCIADLAEILERGDIRNEIIKELEKQHYNISFWLNNQEQQLDIKQATLLKNQLQDYKLTLIGAPRLGQALREVRLISVVKQRLNIPGGCCSFDLPALHLWLQQSSETHAAQINQWLASLEPLKHALYIILLLIRENGAFTEQTSLNGFYQDNANNADLLRLKIPLSAALYPQISGHKTRYAIRFLPLDERHTAHIPEQLSFQLACC